jgi:phosphate:Na+ symporter
LRPARLAVSHAAADRSSSRSAATISATVVLVHLLGDIALLLWGIHMVHSGMLRAFGSRLRRLIGHGLRNRAAALSAGLGVTVLFQSSTATGLMATSFAADRLVALVPALALMLGANIGTALVVQVFSLDLGIIFPLLILCGVVAFRTGGRTRTRDLGRVAIGLGLMLLSIHLLSSLLTPDALSAEAHELLRLLAREPLLTLLAAALLTWAAHSSIAIVLLVVSLADAGLVTGPAALAMVLGANLGSALNPLLEGAGFRGDPARLRLPLGNLLTRLVGCAIVLPLLVPAGEALARLDPDPGRLAANFHLAFNLTVAAFFVLPLPWLARLLKRVLPARRASADQGEPRYLDPAALAAPSMALANAVREVLRMADVVETS